MIQPKRTREKLFLSSLIALSALIIPSLPTFAESPSPAASPVASPAPSASAVFSPTPSPSSTPIPSPTVSAPPVINPAPEFDINKASSPAVVVNKIRPLKPITYKPRDIVYYNGVPLARVASDSLVKLAYALKKAGAGTLALNSGYRAYSTQSWIYKDRVARLGLKAGEALAARPGYSEHQTGLAADVSAVGQGCVIQVCFGSTKAGKWIAANAWQFGYIVRYPNGQTPITGYQYEPWHLRFVGIEIATDMRAKKISVLEKYWGLPAAPAY